MTRFTAVFKGSFRALKNNNFRYFLLGQCISHTGTWMQRSAQIWLVYSLTKISVSCRDSGCLPIPRHFCCFPSFAGVIADRFPKKRILS
jgi:hypothetical protein